MLYYALMATLGSVAGCLALYYVGATRRRRAASQAIQGRHVERGLDADPAATACWR